MEIDSLLPPPDLDACIERFWRLRSAPGEVIALPLLAPGVGAELFFHLGTPFHFSDEALACPPVHLVHPRGKALDFRPQGHLHCLAVRFRAGMIRHFLPCPPGELGTDGSSAEEIWGSIVDQLLDHLAGCPTFENQMELLCQWLRGQRCRYGKMDSAVDAAVGALYGNPVGVRLEVLARAAGLGARQFQRRFKTMIGLSANRFRRLVRLYRLVRQEMLQPGPNYLGAALDLGYFDQAHAIHDFRELTGWSPASFLQEARGRTHFYNPSRGRRT
jgi:AraC-like DNA-binding protein